MIASDGAASGSGRRDVDGILLLDKPLGLSSNQALQRVKRLFRARKAGHTGSLDPLATGMLPICLGQATKVSSYLLDADKTYRVTISFGSRTATGDAEGPVVAEGPPQVAAAALDAALAGFRGAGLQVPPMYSALKHRGRRLYELARQGIDVARDRRPIAIHELVVERYDPQSPVLRVRCSKGTYIRTLVEDIAGAAGTVGHVAALRRLSITPFGEDDMHGLEELGALEASGAALEWLLLPPDRALARWPAVQLEAPEALRLGQGQAVPGRPDVPTGMVRLYAGDGTFLGIGEQSADGRIVPRRLMATGTVPSRPGGGL